MKIRAPHGSTKLGVFPVSIPTKQIQKKSESKKVEQEISNLQLKKKSTPRIILGVDRLDYTKGIKLKLESFKNFLTDNPKYVGKVQLLQVAVPSRTDVPEYIEIRHEIESLVGEINGQFGNINYQPVNYIFNSISNTKLLALYRSSEVLMVSSRRDGMNLVCLEYIVAQNKRNPGVILLSEFTGATSTLSHALSINPHNIVGTSYKIKQALEMPKRREKNVTK